jgi:hypothetical protein
MATFRVCPEGISFCQIPLHRGNILFSLEEFFDASQFRRVGFCRPRKPHAQGRARRPNTRRNFVKAKIRAFDELPESCDQRVFSGLLSILGT